MSSKKKKSSKKKTIAKPYSKKTNKKIQHKTVKPEETQAFSELHDIYEAEKKEEVVKNPDSPKREKAPPLPFMFRRLLEFILPSVLLSLPLETLRYIKAPDAILWGARLSSFSLMIFVIVNIYLYRVFFFSIGNRKVYFRVNIVSYTIFAFITLVFLNYPNSGPIYQFLFMPMNYVSYLLRDIFNSTSPELYRIPSAIITHIFMYLLIFISPLEMYGIEKKLQKRSK